VNDELESLKSMLAQSTQVLSAGGRLVVISYHSLEDRLVKNMILKGRFEGEAEKDLFGNTDFNPLTAINKKPIEASQTEVKENPRARSAKMRVAAHK
jgi:16S rRNA (cytosine1402-N4)-methyltransferase